MTPPVDSVRGTVLLCDLVAPMADGKWLIAGTYTDVRVPTGIDRWECPGLQAYVRILAERSGAFRGRILLVDRSQPAHHPPLHATDFDLAVKDPRLPLEFAWRSPPFAVGRPTGGGHALLLLWLEVAGAALASTPLTIGFS